MLTLRENDPAVLTFADRPVRAVRRRALGAVVRGWARVFRGSAPNAALVLDDAPGVRDMVVVTLGRPRLARGTLTFPVTLVPDPDRRWARRVGRSPDRGLHRRLRERGGARLGGVTLFVDPAAAWRSITVIVEGRAGLPGGVELRGASLGPGSVWLIPPPRPFFWLPIGQNVVWVHGPADGDGLSASLALSIPSLPGDWLLRISWPPGDGPSVTVGQPANPSAPSPATLVPWRASGPDDAYFHVVFDAPR